MVPRTALEPSPPADAPPPAGSLVHLKPRDGRGAFHLAFGLGITGAALLLSCSSVFGAWLAGQVLLALALLQWFAVLHEAGHKTLFRTPWLNAASGHVAGFLALIPFDCWKAVHARHHRWTGWQDLDMTTAPLVPRPLSFFERTVLVWCWRLWVPLVAVSYRLSNYWYLPRLYQHFSCPARRRRLTVAVLLSAAAYAALVWAVGCRPLLTAVGPGLYLTLLMQDFLILSQHTHIPMERSGGHEVRPFSPAEQVVFTRSLAVPAWFARLILLNMDAHELHHMCPGVPGYDLHTLAYRPKNLVPWWRWVLGAKRVRADVLLFQNRTATGFDL